MRLILLLLCILSFALGLEVRVPRPDDKKPTYLHYLAKVKGFFNSTT